MHGPTFMANPLACAAANASLDLFETEPRLEQVAKIEARLRDGLAPCGDISRRAGRAGQGRDWRGAMRLTGRRRRLARENFAEQGVLDPPVRRHRLSDAGLHDPRGSARRPDLFDLLDAARLAFQIVMGGALLDFLHLQAEPVDQLAVGLGVVIGRWSAASRRRRSNWRRPGSTDLRLGAHFGAAGGQAHARLRHDDAGGGDHAHHVERIDRRAAFQRRAGASAPGS